jgi:hypothetical protein
VAIQYCILLSNSIIQLQNTERLGRVISNVLLTLDGSCSNGDPESDSPGYGGSRLYSMPPDNWEALVRQRTIPIERPPLVDEVSVNFSG